MDNKAKQDFYKSLNMKKEEEILNQFSGKGMHCVKCKKSLGTKLKLSFPVKNSLSITVRTKDNTLVRGVPYIKCKCNYENSVLKLASQI